MRVADQPGATVFGGEGYFNLPAVKAQYEDGTPVMISAWELDEGEVAELTAGGRIWLSILGSVHPPVMLSTRSPFEQEGTNDADADAK